MKTITKQVCLNGSYNISKPRPRGVQNHLINVWHCDAGTFSSRAKAAAALRKK